jgi:hypothetical protein
VIKVSFGSDKAVFWLSFEYLFMDLRPKLAKLHLPIFFRQNCHFFCTPLCDISDIHDIDQQSRDIINIVTENRSCVQIMYNLTTNPATVPFFSMVVNKNHGKQFYIMTCTNNAKEAHV